MTCAATKGFLTLGDCGNPASSSCTACGRPMCAAHLSPGSGFSLCYGCAASESPQREEGAEGEYDETWAQGYRSSYYSSSGYTPAHRSGYTSDDTSSFSDRHDDGFDEDNEPGGFDAS
ncbi:MAG TPA: hypothetical protein VF787_24805 [Thermoanaerobaculia bacterium]